MDYQTNLSFCRQPVTKMHIDFNSCFASIEQQANPLLRNKPVAVAAYTTPSGCILAPSIEAKKLGIKVGMRVRDGRQLCPGLIVLSPDPWKYRQVHLKLRRLVSEYTDRFSPKSIDEFVLDLAGYPCYQRGLKKVAIEIKHRIKVEIGDWLQVSIGLGTNRFLAKTAAGLKKPDGLEEIDHTNYQEVYQKLSLLDLCGINTHMEARLHRVGIYSVSAFADASVQTLRAAFQSVASFYWYLRLRGWEIDDFEITRRSFGNSYALPQPLTTVNDLTPVVSRLIQKSMSRMRRAGFKARGIGLSVLYKNGYWHQSTTLNYDLFDFRDGFREIKCLLENSPLQPVRNVAVTCFDLREDNNDQLVLFENILKRKKLVDSIDKINHRWGETIITTANVLQGKQIPDRIGFGGVRELM